MDKRTNNLPITDDPVKELVHSLKPMIEAIQKQQKLYLKQLEPIVREAIASKNHKENELGRLADSLSEMVMFSGAGHELYHEFLDYIDTFNPELTKWHRDNDLEMSGFYDDIIEEADQRGYTRNRNSPQFAQFNDNTIQRRIYCKNKGQPSRNKREAE
jgi:hypothetical protein